MDFHPLATAVRDLAICSGRKCKLEMGRGMQGLICLPIEEDVGFVSTGKVGRWRG